MAEAQRILLVEDDDVGVLLTHALSVAGYRVDLATTNAEAWAHLDTREYALVIADWKLPDGSGTVIADAAAHLGAKTIVMSGYLFQMPGGWADAHETLMKPIRPSELVDVVKRSMSGPAALRK
jgi:DNA-binding response OmpR family regulator